MDRRQRRGGAARRGGPDRAQAQTDLPAFAGRFDRDDGLTRYLRNGRAAGARGNPCEGGTCARRVAGRDLGGELAVASTIRRLLPIQGQGESTVTPGRTPDQLAAADDSLMSTATAP